MSLMKVSLTQLIKFNNNVLAFRNEFNVNALHKNFIFTSCLFVCLLIAARAIFQLSGGCHHVTIAGDRAANFGLCSALMAFEQGGIFIVSHLLRHGTSVYTVSSERPTPMSHSGIQTPDARIIRSLRLTL
jgi:hypothetical protein